jgi:4-alpha-glucanotransferase
VSYRAKEMHAIVNLESHRNKTVIVGENLGTVPPEVNDAMEEHRLRGMYVVQYAQTENPKEALPTVAGNSVASINTHDMPPFAAHWKADDIVDRKKLKILTRAQAQAENVSRKALRKALVRFLRGGKWLKGSANAGQVWEACAKWLAASPSETVLLNLEDFWGETKSQNVPGTFRERPNWRRKTRFTLEEITRSKKLSGLISTLTKLRTIAFSKSEKN